MPNPITENRRSFTQPRDAVIVGKIVGAWGLRGDLKVELHTDDPHRFAPGSVLYLDGSPTRVLRARESKSGLVVKLDLAGDRIHAESLLGTLITVPQEVVKPLPEGSYYYFQIIDIGVWTGEGEYLGDVKEVLATGGNDVYVVRDAAKKEVLVPAVESVILEVDLAQNRMVVRLPEGLE